jgi:1-acyl-sn-glycerol-3-phosphate acyltransferase
MYRFVRGFAALVLKSCYRFQVEGIEKLPEGGFVVACTHMGWLEIVALGVATPQPIHYMAKIELFRFPLTAWFLKKLNSFPVNRQNPGPSSLKTPIRLLKQGKVVGIFPSGTRTSESVPLKRGAAYLAEKAGVPLVPAVYMGPTTLKWKDLFRRKPMTLRFGEPILLDNDRVANQVGVLEKLNERMELFKNDG